MIMISFVLFSLSGLLLKAGSVKAASAPLPTPRGPDRYTTVKVNYTLYEWWLVSWQDNQVSCDFTVDHDDLPTDDDVYNNCGSDVFDAWKANSQPCSQDDTTLCAGFYLQAVGSKPAQKEVVVKLPPPEVYLSLKGCNPDPDGWCTQQPTLVMKASEPLPNESITGIQGIAGNDPFSCKGDHCDFNLQTTSDRGIHMQFWANSSYGDSSQIFDALVRVVDDSKNDSERLTSRYYVYVFSSQWTGAPVASCAQTWEAFPPTDGLPNWLTTPTSAADLASSIPYEYLAGNLITQGVVDISACDDHGVLPDGSVSQCGLDAAKPIVDEWQNRFDGLIFNVAQDTEVPAQLLKNLFSRESQFWPGVFRDSKDVGLGQLTENGADTALLWNPSFYDQFCPLVLDQSVCKKKGYANLKSSQQALLRGALIRTVNASCSDCPFGLDLSRADFSVGVFAHTLLANCEQAGQVVQNVTGSAPGANVSYEDMWRFTLVNYNAGAGCLWDALKSAYHPDSPLDWATVSPLLDQSCPGAVDYVNAISQ